MRPKDNLGAPLLLNASSAEGDLHDVHLHHGIAPVPVLAGSDAPPLPGFRTHCAALLKKNWLLKKRQWMGGCPCQKNACCRACPCAFICEMIIPALMIAPLIWAKAEFCSSAEGCLDVHAGGWGGSINRTIAQQQGLVRHRHRHRSLGLSQSSPYSEEHGRRPPDERLICVSGAEFPRLTTVGVGCCRPKGARRSSPVISLTA
jgi:hypothetical protein